MKRRFNSWSHCSRKAVETLEEKLEIRLIEEKNPDWKDLLEEF
jgi:hypothetical protein